MAARGIPPRLTVFRYTPKNHLTITKKNALEVIEALKLNMHIHGLTLIEIFWNKDLFPLLVEAIIALKNLRILEFERCNFVDERPAMMFEKLRSLQLLNLKFYFWSHTCTLPLEILFHPNTCLSCLVLDGVKVNAGIIKTFADTPTLEVLSIYYSYMKPKLFIMLAKLLETNTTLQELHVVDTRASSIHIMSLVSLLLTNTTLIIMRLAHNMPYQISYLADLKRAIALHPTLEEFRFPKDSASWVSSKITKIRRRNNVAKAATFTDLLVHTAPPKKSLWEGMANLCTAILP